MVAAGGTGRTGGAAPGTGLRRGKQTTVAVALPREPLVPLVETFVTW